MKDREKQIRVLYSVPHKLGAGRIVTRPGNKYVALLQLALMCSCSRGFCIEQYHNESGLCQPLPEPACEFRKSSWAWCGLVRYTMQLSLAG